MSLFIVNEKAYFKCPNCKSKIKVRGQIRNGFSSSNIECITCSEYMNKIQKPNDYKDPVKSSLDELEERKCNENT